MKIFFIIDDTLVDSESAYKKGNQRYVFGVFNNKRRY